MASKPLQLRLMTRPAGAACVAQCPSRGCTAGATEAAASWALLKVRQRLSLRLWLVILHYTARCKRLQAVWSDFANLSASNCSKALCLSSRSSLCMLPPNFPTVIGESFILCMPLTGRGGGAGPGLSGCRVPVGPLGCQLGDPGSHRAAAVRGCALARSACWSVAGAGAAVTGPRAHEQAQLGADRLPARRSAGLLKATALPKKRMLCCQLGRAGAPVCSLTRASSENNGKRVAGTAVISGGLGALGSLAGAWLLIGCAPGAAVLLLGRSGRLTYHGGFSILGSMQQARLHPLQVFSFCAFVPCNISFHLVSLQSHGACDTASMRGAQASIVLAKCDIGSSGDCCSLLQQLQSVRMPVLAHILHAGGVLQVRHHWPNPECAHMPSGPMCI